MTADSDAVDIMGILTLSGRTDTEALVSAAKAYGAVKSARTRGVFGGHDPHADVRPGTPNGADSDRIWHCARCGHWWPINTDPERQCS